MKTYKSLLCLTKPKYGIQIITWKNTCTYCNTHTFHFNFMRRNFNESTNPPISSSSNVGNPLVSLTPTHPSSKEPQSPSLPWNSSISSFSRKLFETDEQKPFRFWL